MAYKSQTPASHAQQGFVRGVVQKIYMGRRRVATCAAALLAVGLGYHVVFGHNGLTAYEQKKLNSVSLDRELGTLQHENELLKGHVDRLQNDPSAIEHQAREELHYTRPGEVIYTLPATSQPANSNSPVPPPSAN